MANTLNYAEQGGEVWHIGGKLIIEAGAEVTGLVTAPAEKIPASEATTIAALKTDFNNLLEALGIMAPAEETNETPGEDTTT